MVAAGVAGMGPRRAAACARGHAYRADPHGFVERGRTERKHRRVGLRPAPDTMAILTGYLPADHGVACLAALRRHTDTVRANGDQRSRDQIMADTLVERLTGHTAAADLNIQLHLLMPLDTLLNPAAGTPAEMAGYGPIPAGIARDILNSSRGRVWWRRLFTAPAGGGGGRRGSVRSPLRPLAGPTDPPAGPDLPRPLLRRPDPPPRSCAPPHRRRTQHPGQRPRAV